MLALEALTGSRIPALDASGALRPDGSSTVRELTDTENESYRPENAHDGQQHGDGRVAVDEARQRMQQHARGEARKHSADRLLPQQDGDDRDAEPDLARTAVVDDMLAVVRPGSDGLGEALGVHEDPHAGRQEADRPDASTILVTPLIGGLEPPRRASVGASVIVVSVRNLTSCGRIPPA